MPKTNAADEMRGLGPSMEEIPSAAVFVILKVKGCEGLPRLLIFLHSERAQCLTGVGIQKSVHRSRHRHPAVGKVSYFVLFYRFFSAS